jgi:putative DNA primase/helicase
MSITGSQIAGNGDPPILANALALSRASVSVVFIEPNGSKRPSGPWRQWQNRLPTEQELRLLFERTARRFGTVDLGLGVLGGVASLGEETLDFDDKGRRFPSWREKVSHIADRLPTVRTPSGGTHVYYRCTTICGNKKIARDADGNVIESRGSGGYVIAPGSSPNCHPSGRTYDQISGPPLTEIPFISPDERKELWQAARSFHDGPSHVEQLAAERAKQIKYEWRKGHGRASSADEFIDRFNREASLTQILAGAGWQSRDGIYWTRPGKQHGTSGRIVSARDGTPLLCVFSTNAGDLSAADGHKIYNAFSAYAAIHHGGNRIAALKELNPRKA